MGSTAALRLLLEHGTLVTHPRARTHKPGNCKQGKDGRWRRGAGDEDTKHLDWINFTCWSQWGNRSKRRQNTEDSITVKMNQMTDSAAASRNNLLIVTASALAHCMRCCAIRRAPTLGQTSSSSWRTASPGHPVQCGSARRNISTTQQRQGPIIWCGGPWQVAPQQRLFRTKKIKNWNLLHIKENSCSQGAEQEGWIVWLMRRKLSVCVWAAGSGKARTSPFRRLYFHCKMNQWTKINICNVVRLGRYKRVPRAWLHGRASVWTGE